MSSLDSITNLEAMIFFCETEFVLFLYTLNVNNKIQFRGWNVTLCRLSDREYIIYYTYVHSSHPKKQIFVFHLKKRYNKYIIYFFFRRAEVLSNRLEVPDEETLEQSPVDQSYFTVREQR